MQYTSHEANKLLNQMKEQYALLLAREMQSRTFLASLGEDPETVRPKYDYAKTQELLDSLASQIRKVKHALNVFNTTTVVPEFQMTVDEMLVFIPQLTAKKAKLSDMRGYLPKQREISVSRTSNIVDYRYVNYDLDMVEEDYTQVSELLAKAQLALDKVNNTYTLEIQ
ncbi:MAG: hypothetical protein IKU26_06980 [Clostridia bacterium]|nr:hypothetical protein [Clostridia bacterium]